MQRFLLSSPVRTLNPEEADWFYVPVYTTCDLTPNGLPLPFKSPRMMRSAIQLIASNWPYWNRTEGADHFFVVPHDFGACFHYQVNQTHLLWKPLVVLSYFVFFLFIYAYACALTLDVNDGLLLLNLLNKVCLVLEVAKLF